MVSAHRHAHAVGVTLLAALAMAVPVAGRPRPGPLGLSPALQRLEQHPALGSKQRLAPRWRKLSRQLREAAADVALATPATPNRLGGPGLAARLDGRVQVAILVAGLTAADRRALAGLGAELTFDDPAFDFVEAWIGVTDLERLAALDFVRAVHPTVAPLTNTGSVTTEGDAILGANLVRAQLGVTGAGVTVGVVSDSVDGLASAQASGDLPPAVQVLKSDPGSGEGTAMLEIVHDLAPGAALAFYGPSTSGDMITGIQQLAAIGAGVIVDDLTFFDQPHFEEGPIAQAINGLAATGVVYVTSAGNFASNASDRGHYEADYVEFGSLGGPALHAHAFAPGSAFQDITVRAGAVGRIFLQWSNPFGAAADDYDLYVVDGDRNIVARSDDPQDGDDLPRETITLDNSGSGSPANLSVVVDRFSGAPQRLELYYAGGIRNIGPSTPAGSIAGNANASGALTVASINAGDPGNDTAASYSSRGPCDLFFPAREVRAKPEVTAIDGVAVTGAAGFPNLFFGTSAAAPHAAAIAALMRSGRPGMSVADVRALLAGTALDLGAPGFDLTFGAGRLQALQAVSAAISVATTTTLPGATTTTAPPGTTTTTLPLGGSAPVVSELHGRLDGDVLTLSGRAADADGDVAQLRVLLTDPAGSPVADSGPVDFQRGGQRLVDLGIQFSGLRAFPTAVAATLSLRDQRGLESAPARADFTAADAGGPAIASVSLKRGGRTIRVRGEGFVRRRTRLEVNGVVLAKRPGVKRRGALAFAKGKPARLNLRSGPNRIRLVTNGAFSNLMIVTR